MLSVHGSSVLTVNTSTLLMSFKYMQIRVRGHLLKKEPSALIHAILCESGNHNFVTLDGAKFLYIQQEPCKRTWEGRLIYVAEQ